MRISASIALTALALVLAPMGIAPAALAQDNTAPADTSKPADQPAAEGTSDTAQAADAGHGEAGGEAAAPVTHEAHIEDVSFPWEGPFGSFDQHQLQRGLQVYTEICSGCHGLKYLAFRSLADEDGPGLPEDQVRAYAATFTVTDHETGEDRPAIPSDHFPAVTSAGAPDLSLMAKARAGFHGPYGLGINQFLRGTGGPEYIHAMLTGFTGEEKDVAGTTFYGNTAFAGGWMAMPNTVFTDGAVTFEDGSPNDLEHMSRDITAFLTWAAEPKMMSRKRAGFTAVGFLLLLTVLLYLTNKRIWAPYKGKKHA